MKTLKDFLSKYGYSAFQYCAKDVFKKLYNKKIIHIFKLGEDDWYSWKNFGSHKNVFLWVLIEDGYAVGFNKNIATGDSFPKVKLKQHTIDDLKLIGISF